MQARLRITVVGAPAATPANGARTARPWGPGRAGDKTTAALAVALYLIRAMRQRVTAA